NADKAHKKHAIAPPVFVFQKDTAQKRTFAGHWRELEHAVIHIDPEHL
uniref:Uncharacterized protein n=1 Tax=Oncorhynchus mykiss TaxID=8022 RepID=A0A8K9X4N3_ONCMY